MSRVRRIYAEKRPGYDVAARQLCQELREALGTDAIARVRLFQRYDVEGLSDAAFESARGIKMCIRDRADPIRVSSLSEPQSVISEQDVSITIKVYNSSQTDMTEQIALYDPNGDLVSTYNGLQGEQSVTCLLYTSANEPTSSGADKSSIVASQAGTA